MMLIVSSNTTRSLSVAHLSEEATERLLVEANDNAAIRRLNIEAHAYDPAAHGGRRLECYMLLQEQTSLWLLQTVGLPQPLNDKVDLVATTPEDLMAKTLFVKPTPCPSQGRGEESTRSLSLERGVLDRQPIGRDSEQTVHLVLLGNSQLAEAMAINAALVAHYPNYCRDARLRTRITIIDDSIHSLSDHLTQRYCQLFDNSYYRLIDLRDDAPRCIVHRPRYEGSRADCVDIEWEFVCGNVRNEAVRQKLREWSCSERQQLTIALCHNDDTRNYNEAFSLPEETYQRAVPVLCHADDAAMLDMVASSEAYQSIQPFSLGMCRLSTLRILKEIGRKINYVYNHCFSLAPDVPITAPAAIDETKLEQLWQQVGSLPKQYSNMFCAMNLGIKMHSLGREAADYESYYALSRAEVDMLTEVEHNRWNVEELILGYRPVTDEEQQLVETDISQKRVLRNKKIHYDIRAFADLRNDSTGKNVFVYDMALVQAIPLIMKSCTIS